MKLEISETHLALMASALSDAITYNAGFLHSETIKDISDYEEHLLCLENFQGWLEKEYRRLEKTHPGLTKYDDVVRNPATRQEPPLQK